MKTFLKVLLIMVLGVVCLRLLPFILGCVALGFAGLLAIGAVLVSGLAGILAITLVVLAVLSPVWVPVLAVIGLISLFRRNGKVAA